MEKQSLNHLVSKLNQRPQARARISGGRAYPDISGRVYFYQTRCGVLVKAEVRGLPCQTGKEVGGIYGFHIHNGSQCTGTADDPFADVLTHYNPQGALHPEHAGDMPPLFGNRGYAFQVFLTDRFSVRELAHKTVVIHSMPDDFTSQPGGNAGKKIACGEIEVFGRC